MREDRRNRAGLAWRLGSPCARVEMFDQNLVHALIGGKDPDGSAELRVNLVLRRVMAPRSSTNDTSTPSTKLPSPDYGRLARHPGV